MSYMVANIGSNFIILRTHVCYIAKNRERNKNIFCYATILRERKKNGTINWQIRTALIENICLLFIVYCMSKLLSGCKT